MSVGDVIRFERLGQELTAGQLGDAVFKVNTVIYNWESGRTSPNCLAVPRICKFLQISPNDLFEWQDGDGYLSDRQLIHEIYTMLNRRRGQNH